ncbi:MAG: hypothetical protein HYZ13_00660 [Acidobacteria bacterium]|nr:hypothetical protein [Acidobacteriota bacterium]
MSSSTKALQGSHPHSPEGDSRALDLLWTTRKVQQDLPREAALAWERAAFAAAFADPEPARRVRAFLHGSR